MSLPHIHVGLSKGLNCSVDGYLVRPTLINQEVRSFLAAKYTYLTICPGSSELHE